MAGSSPGGGAGGAPPSSGGAAPGGGAPAGGSSGAGMGGAAGTGGGGVVPPSSSGLPAPPGEANVPKPAGTPGNITVLNWAGFKGAVTYTFDDNNDSQIANYDQLQAAGGQYTFFLWTNRQQAQNSVWKKALMDGHEIGNHSKSHDPDRQCSTEDVTAATQFIQTNLSVKPLTFASPNGNTCYKSIVQPLFFINRGVSPAQPVMPNGNSDAHNLNCYIPAMNQRADVFNGDVNTARSQGGWVIYVVHGFSTSDGSYMPVNIADMTTAIKYAVGLKDMWVGSLVNVGAYWLGQKAFSNAMTATAGSDKTWTWTLPANFPPGKYLRVKVDGGTLKQKGVALNWDPHGFYEIALDEKSVTLSP